MTEKAFLENFSKLCKYLQKRNKRLWLGMIKSLLTDNIKLSQEIERLKKGESSGEKRDANEENG